MLKERLQVAEELARKAKRAADPTADLPEGWAVAFVRRLLLQSTGLCASQPVLLYTFVLHMCGGRRDAEHVLVCPLYLRYRGASSPAGKCVHTCGAVHKQISSSGRPIRSAGMGTSYLYLLSTLYQSKILVAHCCCAVSRCCCHHCCSNCGRARCCNDQARSLCPLRESNCCAGRQARGQAILLAHQDTEGAMGQAKRRNTHLLKPWLTLELILPSLPCMSSNPMHDFAISESCAARTFPRESINIAVRAMQLLRFCNKSHL